MSRFGSRIRTGGRVDQFMKNPIAGQEITIPFLSDFDNSVPLGNGATGTTVTASATANTYGAWTELIASTSFDVSCIAARSNTNATGVNSGSVTEFGIGAAGSEVALFAFASGSHTASTNFIVPIAIPSGTRIAARLQSVGSSLTSGIRVNPIKTFGDFASASTVDVYGVNLTTSRGVNIATSNAWTEITSSTTRNYRGLILLPSAANATLATENPVFRLGTGASGSETIIAYMRITSNVNEQILYPGITFYYAGHVPAGTRLSVSHSSTQTYYDACVIGVPYL